MTTKLDHLYGASGDITAIEGRLAAVETKATNLSNITVKNNISNQVIPQQRINSSPSEGQHIMRLADTQYTRIVNHTSATSANQVLAWTQGANVLMNERIHNFRIKCTISGVDYIFNCAGWINDKNYKNVFPTFSFASGDNFNETAKIKFWIHENKVKIYSSVALTGVQVYLRFENHR